MAAPEQPQPQRPVELDFAQAMSDFKTMFPDMDVDVIEAVLRSNDGAVDATIDELLTMSSEQSQPDGVPRRPVRREAVDNPDVVPRSTGQKPLNRDHYWTGGGDPSGVPLRIIKNWNPPVLIPLPSDFLRIRIPRSALSRQQQRQGLQQLASERLAACLAENERRRNATDDPELTQVLEDERMALFLQNEEFMRELRADPEFMEALEKESPGSPPATDGQRSKPLDELEAFRERLRNMGKVSKKKFSQIARKFHIHKRKAGGKYMSHVDPPTRDHLLLTSEPLIADDDDDDDGDLSNLNRMRTGNQPGSSAMPHRSEGGKFEQF